MFSPPLFLYLFYLIGRVCLTIYFTVRSGEHRGVVNPETGKDPPGDSSRGSGENDGIGLKSINTYRAEPGG